MVKFFLDFFCTLLDFFDELGVVLGFADGEAGSDDHNGFVALLVENVAVFNVIIVVGAEVVEGLQ